MDKAQELYARKRQGSHSGSRGGSKKSNSTHGDRAQDLYEKQNSKMDIDRDLDNYALVSFFMSIGWPFVFAFPIIGFIGIFMLPVSIVLGVMSLRRIRDDKKLKGRGLAIAGILISSLTMLFGIVMIILFAGLIASVFSGLSVV